MLRSYAFMSSWNTFLCQPVYLIFTVLFRSALAGLCWGGIDQSSNVCRGGILGNMTLEECCNITLATVAWTPTMNSSEFFYKYYLRPVPSMCHRCHKTCDSLRCPDDKKCRMKNGFPTCVCRPACDPTLKSRGRLCGSDGKKYRNFCSLQRSNCKEQRQIWVEYYGKCRRSCKLVQCESGKRCLEDQNGFPHCITCNVACTRHIPDDPRNYICAVDGRTYKNTCELEAEICRQGRSVRIAYQGECKANTNCALTTCPKGNKCLLDHVTGMPVCVNCGIPCAPTEGIKVCGTDGRTYSSYCEMKKIGCYLGQFISTRRNGPCRNKKKKYTSRWRKSRLTPYKDNTIKLKKTADRKQKLKRKKYRQILKRRNSRRTDNNQKNPETNLTSEIKKRRRRTRKESHRRKNS